MKTLLGLFSKNILRQENILNTEGKNINNKIKLMKMAKKRKQ